MDAQVVTVPRGVRVSAGALAVEHDVGHGAPGGHGACPSGPRPSQRLAPRPHQAGPPRHRPRRPALRAPSTRRRAANAPVPTRRDSTQSSTMQGRRAPPGCRSPSTRTLLDACEPAIAAGYRRRRCAALRPHATTYRKLTFIATAPTSPREITAYDWRSSRRRAACMYSRDGIVFRRDTSISTA